MSPHEDSPSPPPARKHERDPIEMRLRELRRSIRGAVFLRGVALSLAAAVGIVLVGFAIDRTFRLSLAGRIACEVLYAGALGYVLWRFLARPFFRRLPERLLADLIERRFPGLEDRFRSALELRREPDVRSDAPTSDIGIAMKRAVVSQAETAARSLEVSEAVDSPRVVSAVAGVAFSLAAGGVFAALLGPSFVTWCERNLLWRDVEWPYRTRLVVEGFPEATHTLGVPRGDPLRLLVRAEGEVPERVRIRIDYERETYRANLPREGDLLFVHDHAEVTEPFRFTVEGGDYRSPPHAVTIKERPEVAALRVTLEFPAYTAKPAQSLEGDIGELAVPEGTTLRLEGAASKELAAATLETEGREVPLEIASGDRRRFAGSYVPDKGGTASIRLADLDGVPQKQWFRFGVAPVPDRVPLVLARAEGVGSMITPAARIPLRIKATDDYGVTALGVAYEIAGQGAAAVEGAAAPQDVKGGRDALPPLEAPAPAIESQAAWEVGPLGLEPDRRLDIRVLAADNDGLHGSKDGFAATQSFLIVTPERLGEELLRREEEQRRILERVIADERVVRDAVYRLVDEAWKAEGALTEAVINEMVGIAKTERQLARQVTSIAGAMRLIGDELENNRMGEVEEMQRLVSAIIEPLTDVAERLLPEAAVKVGRIRELAKADERLRDGLALAADLETLLARLDAVLASMKRLEGFTEIVNRLRGIIKIHEASAEEARKIYRREVDSIFVDPVEPSGGGLGPSPPQGGRSGNDGGR